MSQPAGTVAVQVPTPHIAPLPSFTFNTQQQGQTHVAGNVYMAYGNSI